MKTLLEQRVKHRYENLLIDHAELVEKGEQGNFNVKITKLDADNRYVFFKQKKRNEYVLLSACLLEIAALGSIVTTKGISNEFLVVFAGIINFKKYADLKLGQALLGNATYVSDKGGFYKYKGTARSNDVLLYETHLLAYFLKKPNGLLVDGAKNDNDIVFPEPSCSRLPVKDGFLKHPDLLCLDELIVAEPGNAWGVYRYPEHHFCNKGHFPGKPLMMGVLQLTCVEDLLLQWLYEQQCVGEYQLMGNATIYKNNGEIVAQIKSFEMKAWVSVEGFLDQCEYQAVKKVMFKNPVVPNDLLYIHASFSGYDA